MPNSDTRISPPPFKIYSEGSFSNAVRAKGRPFFVSFFGRAKKESKQRPIMALQKAGIQWLAEHFEFSNYPITHRSYIGTRDKIVQAPDEGKNNLKRLQRKNLRRWKRYIWKYFFADD